MRVGTVCYATRQGLGHLAKSFFDHGIITDPVIYKHPSADKTNNYDWYPEGTPVVRSRRFASQIDLTGVVVMMFFETPFDWQIIPRCRSLNIKTILMPMYEWTPVRWPHKPDVLLCPSLLDYDYFVDEFPDGSVCYLPVPVDTHRYEERQTATRFLHNAGNIGHREHKGTRELLKAVPLVKNPDFRLTVRGQDTDRLREIVRSCEVDDRVTVQCGEIPYDQLWSDHDVYIAPEKFNGLSLPLQEAYAAGMVVMTTDRYPHNTWLPSGPLIPVSDWKRARIGRGYREFDEAMVDPRHIAQIIDEWCGRDISNLSRRAELWGRQNSWNALTPSYLSKL